MGERRGDQPAHETGPQLPGRIRVGLSPTQEAHTDYRDHANACDRCRDIDRGRCEDGERLWRAWTVACNDAYEQLHRGTP